MQFSQLLVLAFAAAASAAPAAAKFNFFTNQSCQRYDQTYVTVTAAQLQQLTAQNWATTPTLERASASLGGPEDKKRCPSNSDDTYKWVS